MSIRRHRKEKKERLQDPGVRGKACYKRFTERSTDRVFQNARVDAILAITGVTKGALYYHVDNKEALGFAVIEDVIADITQGKWLRPFV